MLLKKTTFVKTSSSLVGIFQLDTEWTNCADFISSVLPSKFYHGGGNQKKKKKKKVSSKSLIYCVVPVLAAVRHVTAELSVSLAFAIYAARVVDVV